MRRTPPKPRLSRPSIPDGLPFPIPMLLPSAPTVESKLLPVFSVMWLQPNRKSFRKLGVIVRVQSPTVFQIGADDDPLPNSGCELVLGLFCCALVNRQLIRSLEVGV